MLGPQRTARRLARPACRDVTLDLSEAFEALVDGATGARARDAGVAIRDHALRVARADRRCPHTDQEDCAQEVFFKLFKRLSAGDHPVEQRSREACAAYVTRMVRNWITDRWKTERRRRDGRERFEGERSAASAREDGESALIRDQERGVAVERRAEVRELLERVAGFAIAERQPRHRPHLERGWSEIRAMVFDEVPLRALLEDAGDLGSGADGGAFRRVRNAAYKRHERTRAALEASVASMLEAGRLSGREAELARLAVCRLARCQRRVSPAVPAAAEEES